MTSPGYVWFGSAVLVRAVILGLVELTSLEKLKNICHSHNFKPKQCTRLLSHGLVNRVHFQ